LRFGAGLEDVVIAIARSELRDSYDVVVMGSGVGGLVCAGFLARAGKAVLVLEHHYLPGGYCTAFPRKQHLFDAAVHHIGACGRFGIVGRILSSFQIDLEFVPLDPMDHLVFPDFEFTIPARIEAYAEALESRFPEEKHRIPEFFRDLARLYRQILRREGVLLDRYRGATFGELLGDYFEDPMLRRILGAQWGYLGSPLESISAVGMCQMLVSYLRDGAYYPRGSTQAFSDALARSVLRAGGHVLLKTRVVEVLVEGGRAAGVRLDDGRAIRAGAVVSNVDARQLFCDLVPEGACDVERRRIRTLTAAPSYFGLYLALGPDVDLAELPRGFYYLPQGEGEGPIEWIYLSVTTRYDPGLAPSGNQIVSTTVGVRSSSPEFQDWQDDKQKMARRVLDYLGTRAPGLERGIEFLESASPRTLARYTLAKDGVAYGWAVVPDQSGDARLPSETSLAGLSLTGQWTTPGPGVAAVAASGWSTANRLLGARQ
jgi:phytoene dehydrogenase-like protein